MATSGRTLKLERVKADLSMVAVAAQMGVSRQALWALERAAVVEPTRAQQYRAAVETLRDATESGEPEPVS